MVIVCFTVNPDYSDLCYFEELLGRRSGVGDLGSV